MASAFFIKMTRRILWCGHICKIAAKFQGQKNVVENAGIFTCNLRSTNNSPLSIVNSVVIFQKKQFSISQCDEVT